MYNEEELAKAQVQQPIMRLIIDELQSVVNQYDDLTTETSRKLNMLKRDNYSDHPMVDNESKSEYKSGSIVDDFERLLLEMKTINESSARNLKHLNDIV